MSDDQDLKSFIKTTVLKSENRLKTELDVKFDNRFDDLKQFVETAVNQSELRIKEDIKGDVRKELKKLEKKVDDGFAGIAKIIENPINSRLDDHEDRLVKLEQIAA
ncbi:MAG TPA: hypothetical protein VGF75_04540 [Candidatus Saccharimonadales bacterium]|jgi:hypothetical protein